MLFLIDIDGTICDTYDVDGRCYLQAVDDCFGFNDVSDEWNTYDHVTDSGILRQLFHERMNRLPTDDENDQMIECFCNLLEQEFIGDPESCRPVDGGPQFIKELQDRSIPFVIATGGWKRSALLKLKTSGYQELERYISSADDCVSRLDICKHAVENAQTAHQQKFESIVSIGDGAWDQQTAMAAGFHFVGRTSDPNKFTKDVAFVIPDFKEGNLIQRIMNLEP